MALQRKGESWRPAHRFKWFVSLEGRALLPLATLRPYLLQRGCGWGGRSSKGPTHLPALPRPCPFSLRPRGFSDLEPCLAQLLPREVTREVLGLKGVLSPAVTSFQRPLWPQCSGPGAWLLPGVDVFSPWDGLEGSCAAFFRFVLRN